MGANREPAGSLQGAAACLAGFRGFIVPAAAFEAGRPIAGVRSSGELGIAITHVPEGEFEGVEGS